MNITAFLCIAALVMLAVTVSLAVESGVANQVAGRSRYRLDVWVYVFGSAALAAALLAGVSL